MSLSAAGPHACPFVALSEDRDARSAGPDQAHRCYAEERPEPRPLSHQRAYCLTREYAVCPYFLDWAGRLAARKVGPTVQPFAGYHDEGTDESDGGLRQAGAPRLLGAGGSAQAELGLAPSRRRSAALTAPAGSGSARAYVDAAEVEEIDEVGRLVGRGRRAVGPGGALGTIALPLLDRVGRGDDGEEEDDDAASEAAALHGAGTATRGRPFRGRAGIFGDRARNFAGRVAGPAWEPRRIEDDYPRLRIPASLPPVPPLALAAVALVIAALAILVLPGFLGGARQPEPTTRPGVAPVASPSPRPSESVAPSATATERPQRRFRNYTVKPGDTLAAIAERFGVTVRQIRDANPKITNPNRIRAGERIRIPIRQASGQGQEPSPSPSG